ncbi:hypothetical protein EPN95_04010 [Patescibacteria group bacterium]|nr:MAG: hypothetical protein EPN95_04010 [Patescibacteria group bacterium]
MNIVAIGGGDRKPAIKKGLELAGDPSRVLIIPTAASTERSYTRKVSDTMKLFGELGINADLLHDFGEDPSTTRVQHELGRASLIFTIGGNTPYMIQKMTEHGTNNLLKKAIENGVVHVGSSAGALLPFSLAHSNVAARPAEVQWDYEYLAPGVDAIYGVATAHADQHDPIPGGLRPDSRLEALLNTFPEDINRGFAIDNNAAAIFGNDPEIVRARPNANVRVLTRNSHDSLDQRIAELTDLTTS